MIKAGALLYAMFLVIIIAMISSSFIVVNYYNSSYVIHILKEEQLFQDVNSGINYGLFFHKEIPLNNKIEIDLYEDGRHKVKLCKKNWGVFYVITAESAWKNKLISKSVLVGSNINDGEKIGLYLAEQGKPLALSGKTIIKGDCYLPKSGVKWAYVEGKSFIGRELINGLKKNSDKLLPTIKEELIQQNKSQLSLVETENDSVVDFEYVMEKDSIINSFKNKRLVIYSPLSIVLSNQVIKGNVVIKSANKITVKSKVTITDAILYAKGIVVQKKFKGAVQLFASDSIVIENDCELRYPSVVALLAKNVTSTVCKITVNKNVKLKGAIFLVNKKNQGEISIGKNSVITGQVYSSGLLQFEGEVYGSVFCKKFILKTVSSIYENHLMDAVIDRERLPEFFVGVSLTETIKQQKNIKWLD